MVIRALAEYPVTGDSLKAFRDVTNMNFKVTADDGRRFILRVCSPNWRTATDLQSEVEWLLAIHRDTDIQAPVPMLTWRGEPFTTVSANGMGPLRCVMLSWLPGTLMRYRLTCENLRKMGRLFADLHRHGETFKPSDRFTQRRMHRVLARDEPDALFSESAQRLLDRRLRGRLHETRRIVMEAYEKRYSDPRGLRVIHHDLHHDNILIHGDTLQPFDFEDTVWGYPVQDIAMAMLDLLDEVGPQQYPRLLAAFHAGYTSRLPWPELYPGEIVRFQRGRRLWVANWFARFEPCELKGFLTRHLTEDIPCK